MTVDTADQKELAEQLLAPAGQPHGTRSKTVLTEIGPVEIEVARGPESAFEPQIVRKRQRRLTGVDEIVLSLTARGLTGHGRGLATWRDC